MHDLIPCPSEEWLQNRKFEVLRSDELKSDNETTSDRKAGRSGGYLGDTVSQGPCLRSHSMFKSVKKDKEPIKAYQKYLQD